MAVEWCFHKNLHENFDKFVRKFIFSKVLGWAFISLLINLTWSVFQLVCRDFQNGIFQEYKPRVVSVMFFWII